MALTENASTFHTILDIKVEDLDESEVPTEVTVNSDNCENAKEKEKTLLIDVTSGSDTSQPITNLAPETSNNKRKLKSPRKKVTERSYMCNLCGKKFLHVGHYSRHCKIHRSNSFTTKKSKFDSGRPDVSGESESSAYYSYLSSFSLSERKQKINRSFVCAICGKGYGRNSHLKRHVKLHKANVLEEQARVKSARASSLVPEAILSDSDISETTAEHSDIGSTEKSAEKIKPPLFIDLSTINLVKSESPHSLNLDKVPVLVKSPDEVDSSLIETAGSRYLKSDYCNSLEFIKSTKECDILLSESSEDKEDLIKDRVFVKIEQGDCSVENNEIIKEIDDNEMQSDDTLDIYKLNHEIENDLECKICNKTFRRKSHLTRHVKLHVNKEIHDCGICGKRFLQSAYLKAHMSTVHAEIRHELERIYACPICEKKFGRMSHLKRHIKLHVGGKTYDCKVCGKKFLQNSNLKSHEKSHADLLTSIDGGLVKRHIDKRTNTEYFECEQCGKIFQQMSSLKAHINTVHIGDKTLEKCFECSFCGKEFGRNSHLKRHLKLHIGGQTFTCDLCGREFKQNGNLKAHIRMVHLKERPHQCTYCGKMFLQQSNLNTHIRTHTGEKPYGCTVCGKNFTQGNQLKYHLRTHYGETPFSCLCCGKTFTNNRSCQRHMKIHAGDNPLECSVCFEEFSNENEMKAHLRSHAKESVKKRLTRSLTLSRFTEGDSLVDSVTGTNGSDSEVGVIDSDDGSTDIGVTLIKEELDVTVKDEPEANESVSDYGSSNENEDMSRMDDGNLLAEGIEYHEVIKSINESIKDMTKNKNLLLERSERDLDDTGLNCKDETLKDGSIDRGLDCVDPLDGV